MPLPSSVRYLALAFLGISLATLLPGQSVAQTSSPPTVLPEASKETPHANHIDPAAMAVMQKSDKAMLALKTYQVKWAESFLSGDEIKHSIHTVTASKPNLFRREYWQVKTSTGAKATTPSMALVYDGKMYWQQLGKHYTATPMNRPPAIEDLRGFYSAKDPFAAYVAKEIANKNQTVEVRLLPAETVGGVLCDRVSVLTTRFSKANRRNLDLRSVYYVGRSDGLIRRTTLNGDWEFRGNVIHSNSNSVVERLVVNAAIPHSKTVFAYTPPKGITKEKPRNTERSSAPPLLARGTLAPDLTATDTEGKTVKLSDFRGKVVILDFWASWCPPCVASMPHNQKVTRKLQDEGLPVVLLAVDNAEERPRFLHWVKEHPEMDALTFVYIDSRIKAADLYKVSGIPTQYIIDPNGVIRAATVGFDGGTNALEKSVRAALEK